MTQKTRRPILWVALIAIVVLVAGGAALALRFIQSSRDTVIPAGVPTGELAFIADRDGTWDIYLMDEAGNIQNLTTDGVGNDYFVSWDFKSERLNFIADRTDELGPVQVQPDGTGLRTLGVLDAVTTMFFEGRLDWDPAWSADGTKLLWSSLRDLNLEIYTGSVDGEAETRLTDTPARDWFASWSPDSTRIAFTSDRGGSEDIWVMNADGSNLRQLTNHSADDIHPAWSLDGETLLFVSERRTPLSSGTIEFFVVSADGDEAVVRPLDAGEVWEGDPIWSADGKSMLYVSNRDEEATVGSWSLYQRDTETGQTRRLTDGSFNALFPVWRPQTQNVQQAQ